MKLSRSYMAYKAEISLYIGLIQSLHPFYTVILPYFLPLENTANFPFSFLPCLSICELLNRII